MTYAEAADSAQNVAVEGLLRQKLDAFLGAVATADVNAGIGVGHGFRLGFLCHGEDFLRMDFWNRLPPGNTRRKVDFISLCREGGSGLCYGLRISARFLGRKQSKVPLGTSNLASR